MALRVSGFSSGKFVVLQIISVRDELQYIIFFYVFLYYQSFLISEG